MRGVAGRSRALMARVQLTGNSVAQGCMVCRRDPWGPVLLLWSPEGPWKWDSCSLFMVYYKAQIIKYNFYFLRNSRGEPLDLKVTVNNLV